MTLENSLLEKLLDWRPASGRQTLLVSDPSSPWSVSLTADRADELGCLVCDLTLSRLTIAADATALRKLADGLAADVKALDVLKVIEIDDERGEGFLRSATPTSRKDRLYYYELFLKGTREVGVRRYQAAENGKREQVAFAATHEALARLVGEIVGVD